MSGRPSQKTVLRWVRRVLLLLLAVIVYFAFRGYAFYSMPDRDTSMDPTYPAGALLLTVRLDEDDVLERGDDVVYAVRRDGVEYARFGRVRGLAGDRVSEEAGRLLVNGEPTGLSGPALGTVPPGHVLVLNLNPLESRYTDSRELGFIPRADVRNRIRARVALGG